jgi:hypothetical protein
MEAGYMIFLGIKMRLKYLNIGDSDMMSFGNCYSIENMLSPWILPRSLYVTYFPCNVGLSSIYQERIG